MDICETYSDRKLFATIGNFTKAAFGSDYSETLLSSLWTFLTIGLFIIQMTYMKLLTGWYRKNFSYQKKEGIRTFIRFDGVYMDRRCM